MIFPLSCYSVVLCATCVTYSAPWTAAQRCVCVCWWRFETLVSPSLIEVTQPPVTPLSVPSKGDESIPLCLTKQNISFHQKVPQSWRNLEFKCCRSFGCLVCPLSSWLTLSSDCLCRGHFCFASKKDMELTFSGDVWGVFRLSGLHSKIKLCKDCLAA